MDENNCIVDIAKFFLEFTVDESCGMPTVPYRTKRMLSHERITGGKGKMEDIDKLETLAKNIIASASARTVGSSLCSARKYSGMVHRPVGTRMPAGVCKSMLSYVIHSDRCELRHMYKALSCRRDQRDKKVPYVIDQENASNAALVWRNVHQGNIQECVM